MLLILLLCSGAVLMRSQWLIFQSEVRPSQLFGVIARQFEALQAEDFPRAYTHVSLGVQQRINVLQYAESVRTDLGSILRAKQIEFGTCRAEGKHAVVQVFFLDERGAVTPCLCSMVRESDSWKIDSISVLKRWQPGRQLGGARA